MGKVSIMTIRYYETHGSRNTQKHSMVRFLCIYNVMNKMIQAKNEKGV